MSKKELTSINCPRCGEKIPVLIWDSVNVTLDPAAKEEFLNGKINTCTCEKCGATVSIFVNLLYHDMENKFMVCRADEDELEDIVAGYKEFAYQPKEIGINLIEQGYKIRIVTSQNRHQEKVHIFDAGLDDRAVELCKLLARDWAKKNHPEIADKEILFAPAKPEPVLLFMTGKEDYQPLVKLVYENMAELLKHIPDDEFVIDTEWAKKFAKENFKGFEE